MSPSKNLTDFTNWLSFLHDEYVSAIHMGKYNFDSIQLAAKWWGWFLECKFLEDQSNIIYFMAAMFRQVNKHVLRGGIGHMAQKGNEDIEALLQTATRIEKISFKNIVQPNITFTSPKEIKPGSWENRFEFLAVDMLLYPENYPEGYQIQTENSYSSPIVLTALKIYIQTLERGVGYEIKRKVINKMNEAEESINKYIEEANERVDSFFSESATKINETAKKIDELEQVVDSKIQGLKGKINLVLKKQVDELEKRFQKLSRLSSTIDEMEKDLGNKELFQGFMGKRNLKKLLKAIEE